MKLPRAIFDAIVRQARDAFPDECCGLLGGRGEEVSECLPVRNAERSPTRFRMEAQDQFRALQALDRAGLEITGIYHSHPRSRCWPSSRDLDGAFAPGTNTPLYPGAVYVIVALDGQGPSEVRGFRLRERQVFEEPLEVVDGHRGSQA
ncbi:MAG: M67 family metallopeptidase [Deltaproteobacteria bacterium]|nr:M67 family metallopeptidase [Deltaproteobacteria bacterium]